VNIELVDITPLGTFEFRWPDATESFERGWKGTVVVDGRTSRFQHGIGNREAYGRKRMHTVTWIDEQPIIEGVAADDFDRSRCVITAIKRPDGKLARREREVPPDWDSFTIVDHRSEIAARYSRRCLAIKVPAEDPEAWATLAVLRARDRGLGRRQPSEGPRERGRAEGPAASIEQRPVPSTRSANGASPGLEALMELEEGLDLVDLTGRIRVYEQTTDYDRALIELQQMSVGSLDLFNAEHRRALLRWLRAWGCRHLRLESETQTSAALLRWAERWAADLPGPHESLTDLPPEAITSAAIAWGRLSEMQAAERIRGSGTSVVRFGPTAAAKALYALRPQAFPPWDEPIRRGLGFGDTDAAYRAFLHVVAGALRSLSARSGIAIPDLPRHVGRPDSSPPKLIDEYLWIRITRRLPAP